MAKLGIQTSSSPFDYTKLIAPLEKQVEEYDKAVDAISTTAGSLGSLDPYLENLKDSDNKYIKDYFAIQREANDLADKAANRQISKSELLAKSRDLNRRMRSVVPILENAVKGYTQAMSTQRANAGKGYIVVNGASDLTQFIGGNAPDTRYINPDEITKFGYNYGVSAAKAAGQRTHFDKAKTKTINGVNYTILPTETGIEATDGNVATLMATPGLIEQVKAQFNIPSEVDIAPYLRSGMMSGLNASYSKGESVQHYQGKTDSNPKKDPSRIQLHDTDYFYILPTDEFVDDVTESPWGRHLYNPQGKMIRVKASGNDYYVVVNRPVKDKDGKIKRDKNNKVITYPEYIYLDENAKRSSMFQVRDKTSTTTDPNTQKTKTSTKQIAVYLNGEKRDFIGDAFSSAEDFTPTLGEFYKDNSNGSGGDWRGLLGLPGFGDNEGDATAVNGGTYEYRE